MMLQRFARLFWVSYLLAGLAISSACLVSPVEASAPTPTTPQAPRLDVPILLYHRVGQVDDERFERYTVSLHTFEQQMRSLKAWGYQTITLGELTAALMDGDHLPPRPVIITFDDGYQDVYTNAFPVLEALDFDATVFVIGRQIGIKGYLNKAKLRNLLDKGWQAGNHTYNHYSLLSPAINLKLEIETARADLEEILGVPVAYFSFPYGLTSTYVTRQVTRAGYTAAVGLGGSFRHGPESRYYFSRIEIKPELNILEFMELLPWAGPPGGRGIWNILIQ